MMMIILLSTFKDVIHLILFYNDSFLIIMNAYIVRLSDFSYLIVIILIMMMF